MHLSYANSPAAASVCVVVKFHVSCSAFTCKLQASAAARILACSGLVRG